MSKFKEYLEAKMDSNKISSVISEYIKSKRRDWESGNWTAKKIAKDIVVGIEDGYQSMLQDEAQKLSKSLHAEVTMFCSTLIDELKKELKDVL